MKPAVVLAFVGALAVTQASEVHVRVHPKSHYSQCQIPIWTRCDNAGNGPQACCAGEFVDCTWDPAQGYKRCIPRSNAGEAAGTSAKGSVGVWGQCSDTNGCQEGLTCVKHSPYYSQCKPAQLPQGELCGQKKADMDWFYDHCPSGQKCLKQGDDFRCQNARHHRRRHSDKSNPAQCEIPQWSRCDNWASGAHDCCKGVPEFECRWDSAVGYKRCLPTQNNNGGGQGGSCTITDWSQCDGQNWSFRTCCANPSFECRWADNGNNVKLCQPRRHHKHH